MNETERASCAALASLLRAAGVLALWGFVLTVLAALALVLGPHHVSNPAGFGLAIVVAVGVLERYFAYRLRFDAGLFDGLARGDIVSLDALDHALGSLGLRAASPEPQTPRSLADRVRGTRRLMQRHAVVVGSQSALFFMVLITQEMS